MKTLITLTAFLILAFNPAKNESTWIGSFSNGYKGATISFDITADGKRLENLTFKGYWRCSGRTEQITMGPDKSYAIQNGVVTGVITEPENGGSSAFRFDLNAVVGSKTASGTLRININALSCDTYLLKWTAQKK